MQLKPDPSPINITSPIQYQKQGKFNQKVYTEQVSLKKYDP